MKISERILMSILETVFGIALVAYFITALTLETIKYGLGVRELATNLGGWMIFLAVAIPTFVVMTGRNIITGNYY
jgi:hypothetical protein